MRPDYYIHNNALTLEDCKTVIDWGEKIATPAKIANNKINPFKRRSKTAWITKGSDLDYIVDKLLFSFIDIANHGYKQRINNVEAIQFTKYSFGGFYGWHMDAGLSGPNRILSASVELSDPDSYKGGGLKFYHHPTPVPKREQGSMIMFPSLMLHKARPVYWGTRYSLVLWASMDWEEEELLIEQNKMV